MATSKFEKWLVKGIRNKTLQNLLYIWANLFLTRHAALRRDIEARLESKGFVIDKNSIVFELRASEIQEILGCSRRTANDYLATLRKLYL